MKIAQKAARHIVQRYLATVLARVEIFIISKQFLLCKENIEKKLKKKNTIY